jgi:hypothetical protein
LPSKRSRSNNESNRQLKVKTLHTGLEKKQEQNFARDAAQLNTTTRCRKSEGLQCPRESQRHKMGLTWHWAVFSAVKLRAYKVFQAGRGHAGSPRQGLMSSFLLVACVTEA